MDPLTIALISIAAVAEIGKGYFEYRSADTRKEALNQQSQLSQLQYEQKTIANYDQTQKILEAQKAEMTVRGVSMSSPSYKAISGETYNIGTKRQKNIDIDERIQQGNLKLENKNVNDTLFAQLFGGAADIAEFSFKAFSKAPKTK